MVKIDGDILATIESIAENTIGYEVYLGGGILRDVYLGVKPKDIDLFFVPVENAPQYLLHDTHRNLQFSYRMETNETQSLYQRGVEQLIGFKTPSLVVPELQFIVYGTTLTAEELTEDMDIGICQIMYHIFSGKFYVSENFKKDVAAKEIRCYHKYDKYRMIERFDRMQRKFPDFKCVGKPTVGFNDFIDSPIEAISSVYRKIKPRKVSCSSGY
jgi:hypothetical protein